jgi:uncharacterized surface protein with fasciclin (FAS1) repeats
MPTTVNGGKAGLASTLDGAGPFTVFAPSDSAFLASGINSAAISSLSAGKLDTILLYHTIASKISSSQVPAGIAVRFLVVKN